MVKVKDLKEEDRIKNLGDKICRFAKYYEKGKNVILESNMRKKTVKLNGKKKEIYQQKGTKLEGDMNG